MEIVALAPGDDAAVVAAQHLFDGPARAEETRRFLGEPGHHLLIAREDGEPVGFASGIEVVHPDKRVELMLYEIAVDEPARRKGVGRALVAALTDLATSWAARSCSCSPTATTPARSRSTTRWLPRGATTASCSPGPWDH